MPTPRKPAEPASTDPSASADPQLSAADQDAIAEKVAAKLKGAPADPATTTEPDEGKPASPAVQQQDARQVVRDELAKISQVQQHQETQDRLARVEQVVEKPPKRLSKIAQALWGSGGDDDE